MAILRGFRCCKVAKKKLVSWQISRNTNCFLIVSLMFSSTRKITKNSTPKAEKEQQIYKLS